MRSLKINKNIPYEFNTVNHPSNFTVMSTKSLKIDKKNNLFLGKDKN